MVTLVAAACIRTDNVVIILPADYVAYVPDCGFVLGKLKESDAELGTAPFV